jgi:hypothetical protein
VKKESDSPKLLEEEATDDILIESKQRIAREEPNDNTTTFEKLTAVLLDVMKKLYMRIRFIDINVMS